MQAAKRITCFGVVAVIAAFAIAAALGCGSKKEVKAARRSQYDADFAVVYNAVLAAVRADYPRLTEDPARGAIKTLWYPVNYDPSGTDDPKSVQSADRAMGLDNRRQSALSGNVSSARRRYFVRFDVTVAGGRPWRVRVVGRAQEWVPGNAVPTDLRGAATPHWLNGRTEALIVGVYKRLQKYAVEVAEDVTPPPEAEPVIDVTVFGAVPPAVGTLLGTLRQILSTRDYGALRAQLAPDVVWSFGGDTGPNAAMAAWQADPTALDAMAALLTRPCAVDGAEVVCPAEAAAPGYADWRLRVGQRSGAWRITAFVAGD